MLRTEYIGDLVLFSNEPVSAQVARALFGEDYPRWYEKYIDELLYDVAYFDATDKRAPALRREQQKSDRGLRIRDGKRFCALTVAVLLYHHRHSEEPQRGDRKLLACAAVRLYDLVVSLDRRSWGRANRWKGFAEYIDEVRSGRFDLAVRETLQYRLDLLTQVQEAA
ncbi:hypothetical protein ML401_07020 [Bradyrhizobium sp. 62B]|uniref:hypothetical protein n=1 Tax=Bradyrhizobium sp. 62B TaxID=2898442 RepID=UPI0025580CE2|nr:hypothetical protein ML401_07020 [Bradyrhizobium sp. 62B]